MHTIFPFLLLCAFVVLIAGGAWRRRGAPLAPRRTRMMVLGLAIVAMVAAALIFVWGR